MHDPTHHTPTTRGNGAASVLVLATLGALILAAVVTLHPVALGGVGLVALVLGVVGIGAGVVVEGGAR